jgi:hypothetical protein
MQHAHRLCAGSFLAKQRSFPSKPTATRTPTVMSEESFVPISVAAMRREARTAIAVWVIA